MHKIGDTIGPLLDSIRRRLDAGELPIAEDGAWEDMQRRDREEQLRRDKERRIGLLSRRHVADARRLLRGELPKSKIWQAMSDVFRDTPNASLLLCGQTGAGKTTAATGYALTRINGGWTALHIAASRFATIAKHEEAREEAESADLVLLDELHRVEGLADWVSTELVGLIDARYQAERQTIGIATVPPKEIEKIVGREVVERFDRTLATDEESYRNG